MGAGHVRTVLFIQVISAPLPHKTEYYTHLTIQWIFKSHNQMNCWSPNNTNKERQFVVLMFSRQKLRQHQIEALTRWYDHDLDVFSKPVEQDIL